MSVKIKKTAPGSYDVNGKLIYTDMNGNLVAWVELSTLELQEFHKYLTSDAREASDNQSK